MPTPAYTWITDAAGLERLAADVVAAPWTALDSESNSMFVYRERVCLLQLNVGGALALVDTLALPVGAGALGALGEALADPHRRLYLHGGEYDVACLKRDYDVAIANVFDTQQAASLLGITRTGYGSLVEDLLGVSLDKGHAQYDWARRPVDPDALRYALDDVVYLPALAERLEAIVAEADLAEEVAVACRAVCDAAAHEPGFDPLKVYRLKGIEELDDAQRGVLMALFTWRDAAAAAADVPPARLLAHGALLQLARRAPRDLQELTRTSARRLVPRYGPKILSVIEAALADPPRLPPRPRNPPPPPEQRAREDRLKQWRKREAARRGVTTQVVLPARAIEHLKVHGADDLDAVPQLGPKRIRLYGDKLRQLAR